MRKLLFALLLATSPLFAQTAAITGNLAAPDNTAIGTRTFVRFELKNTGGQQCKVAGVALVTPFLKDFTPNVSGALSFNILRNDQITCGSQTGQTQWAFTLFRDGTPGAPCFTQITTASVNLNSLTCSNTIAVVTPPTGDTTYLRLDGSNVATAANPFHFSNPIAAPRVGGFYMVDGTNYLTPQLAITAACAAGGGTVFIGPGTYAQNIPFVLCSNLNIFSAGRCDVSSGGLCLGSTVITTTLSSGDLFPVTNMTDIGLAGFTVKSTSAGGAGCAIRLNYGQRIVAMNLFLWLQGFSCGIELDTDSTSTGSTIRNSFSDIFIGNLAANGNGCVLNSHAATNKVIDSNFFKMVACQAGTGGKGLWVTNSGVALQQINENWFFGDEFACADGAAGTGTGIQIDAGSTKDLRLEQPNIESCGTGFHKFTSNTVLVTGGNISSNGSPSVLATNLVDAQPAFTSFLHTSIGGASPNFHVDALGNVQVNALCLGGVPCDPGNINGTSGYAIEASGTTVATVNNTALTLNRPLDNASVAFAALGTPANGRQVYCSDCMIANPCANGGTGAFAKRINGAWVCN